jgi:hypothetical protein
VSLEYRPLEPVDDDLRRLADAFAANGAPRDPRVLRWWYLANPVIADDPGALYVDVASEEGSGKIAGVYATFPVELQIARHRTVALQSVDTLTDAAYRHQGLFPQLAGSLYDRSRLKGVALVHGFPNAESASGFFGPLGWSKLDPVPFLFLPLRARLALRRFGLGRLASGWPDRLPVRLPGPDLAADEEVAVALQLEPGVDELWDRFSTALRIAVIRDRKYLGWRLARPGAAYKVLVLRRVGEIRALAVLRTRDRADGRYGYVMELMHLPDDRRSGEILLNAAIDDLDAQGVDAVLAWSLEHSPTRSTYRRVGFRSLPASLRSTELHFGARPLDAPADVGIGDRRSWYLSYLDSDTL